jgi:hypothetical protein
MDLDINMKTIEEITNTFERSNCSFLASLTHADPRSPILDAVNGGMKEILLLLCDQISAMIKQQTCDIGMSTSTESDYTGVVKVAMSIALGSPPLNTLVTGELLIVDDIAPSHAAHFAQHRG